MDANPEAHEHARLRYRRGKPALRARAGGGVRRAVRRDRLPADDRARPRARPAVGALRRRRAADAYVTTPNRLTLAPPGAEKSDNPWHLREYTPGRVPRAPGAALRARRGARRLSTPGKLRVHELALRLGWDRVHRALRLTKPFYDRFVPAISSSDFELAPDRDLDRAARLPRRLPCLGDEPRAAARRSAIWRSSCTRTCPTSRASGPIRSARSGCSTRSPAPTCRVLERARDLTLTVTPVLADQLEAPGVAERMEAFLRRYRLEAAERDAAAASPELRPRGRGRGRALSPLPGAPARTSRATCSRRSGCAAASETSRWCRPAATHAVLPLVATTAGRRLQIDAGLRSHRRRFGAAEGFWLPECAYRPGIERAPGRARPAVLLHRPERPRASARRAGAGPRRVPGWSPSRSTGRRWSSSGREGGYPSDPAYAEFHRASIEGSRLWAIGGDHYDPAAARARAERHAESFADAVAERLAAFRERARQPAAWSPSRSTPSCSAIGGRRARPGSAAVLRHVPRARHPPGHPAPGARAPCARGATAARVDLGRGQGPSHLGLAGGRRPRLGGAAAGAPPAARRSSRTSSPRPPPSGPRASCSRSRRATGRSWIAASRPATIPTSAPRPTRGRCSKPYTPASRRTPACETWPPTSASSRCSSPEQLCAPDGARPRSSPGSTRR